MAKPTYRPDIDGLRAIAVLSVVLYHYGIGSIHGGFVGVDIFFVISGYLITGIIQKEISRGEFTFSGFYERRIRRIFPALFAMLFVTLVTSAWLLLPSDLRRLGSAALATLLFGSNVLFWRQSGYFDPSSEYNPLLHTWSLAVEEQFYIALPVLLILLHRFARGWLKPALIVCAIVSFAFCIWVQKFRPTATFFLSPFRAWELLVGGWLAIGVIPPILAARLRLLVSAAALALLLFSLWWIKAGPDFPGWQAVLPVAATAALLHAGAQGSSSIQRLLCLKPLVFIGLISYSLYLWHWPLIVFVRYRNALEPVAPVVAWLLLGVAIVFAAASYRWIETPLRRRKKGAPGRPRRAVFAGATMGSVLLAGGALAVRLEEGWQARFSPEVVALDNARRPVIPFLSCDGRTPDFNTNSCRIGVKNRPPRVLLWGDSHALAWAPALDEVLRRYGASGILAVNSACPPLFGVNNPIDMHCYADNQRLLSKIRGRQFDSIVMVASWSSYAAPSGQYVLFDDAGRTGNQAVFEPAFDRTLRLIRPLTNRIVLIGPTPGAPDDIPFRMAVAKVKAEPAPASKSETIVWEKTKWFWRVVERYPHDSRLILVDPSNWFCSHGSCRYQSEGGQLLYRDGGHLSLNGARFVAMHLITDVFGHDGLFLPTPDGLRPRAGDAHAVMPQH